MTALAVILGALLAAAAGVAIKRGDFGWAAYFTFMSLVVLVAIATGKS